MPTVLIDQGPSVLQLVVDLALAPSDPLVPMLPFLWQSYADKVAVYPRLQYYYTRRAALSVLLNRTVGNYDWSQAGVSEKAEQVFAHWQALQSVNDVMIKDLEAKAVASRAPAIGVMTATQPGPVLPYPYPNPASGYYRGQPYAWPSSAPDGAAPDGLPPGPVTEDGEGF